MSCYYCKPEELDIHYYGCYQDDAARDFDYGPQEYGYTPETCRDACSDYTFFALQDGGWCSCDMSFGSPSDTYPRIEDSACEKDGESKYFGGAWANAVFSNNRYVEPVVYVPIGPELHTPDDSTYYALRDAG